jgi:hypothetical protein
MPRKKIPAVAKRQATFNQRLKTVRGFVAGFDSDKWAKLYNSKPRTEATKAKKRAALAKVNRVFKQLKPFVQRSYKVVRPKNAARVAALAEYANVPKVKGLRAVPVATDMPKKLKVGFNSKNQVTLSHGAHHKEVVIKFPRRPRSHTTARGKFLTAGEDALQMTEALLPTMKAGRYVVLTRSQTLVPFSADKGQLMQLMRSFVLSYEGGAPELIRNLIGFKWLARSNKAAQDRINAILAARSEAGRRRVDQRREQLAKEAKRLGKISKRARATGRR